MALNTKRIYNRATILADSLAWQALKRTHLSVLAALWR
jgi:hypothetical protein